MSESRECPICTTNEVITNADGGFDCQTCGHEWFGELDSGLDNIRDSSGTLLANGDSITIIKDIKLNGKAGGVKVGTKVRSIRLIPGDHEIEGKVDGRTLMIKAEFVRKA